jgi:hypothetical protein
VRLTDYQEMVIARIETGQRDLTDDCPSDFLEMQSFQWSRDGDSVVAHRTVLRDDATGDPRLDFRTELYRITRDGRTIRL